MWEDRVFADPDGVDVDALFEDLHSDDERTQYEAAVGVYWLASFRPGRVRPREDELLALVGNLPDFGLGDSSGTRNWFGEAVAELVNAYPDRLLPPMIERLDADRETTREDAAYVLSVAADRTPSPVLLRNLRNRRSRLVEFLDDSNGAVRTDALWTLAGIADEYPEAVTDLVPRITPFLDRTPPAASAAVLLHRVAVESPEKADSAVEPLVDALGRLDVEDVRTSGRVLEALLALVEAYPARVATAELDAARLARSEYPLVSRPAVELLRELRA